MTTLQRGIVLTNILGATAVGSAMIFAPNKFLETAMKNVEPLEQNKALLSITAYVTSCTTNI